MRKPLGKAKPAPFKPKPGDAPGRASPPGTLGQPAFTPTPEQREAVKVMVSFGTTFETISRLLRIPINTLTRHFKEELTSGREEIFARIGTSIVADALAGDRVMRIFFAKTHMGWVEARHLAAAGGSGGGAAPALFTVNIS
jgi:hypothetical protein